MKKMYVIKAIDEIPLSDIVTFYRKHGSSAQSNIKNKLFTNGRSTAVGAVAEDPDTHQLVGAYLAKPQRLLCSPNLKAYQSMDTLVAECARGNSVTEKMGEHLYDRLRKSNATHIVGVPNKLIEPIRLERLHWRRIKQIYRFTFFAPRLLSNLIRNFFPVHDITENLTGVVTDEEIISLVKEVKERSNAVKVVSVKGIPFITTKNNDRVEIGAIRPNSRLNFLKRILLLMAISSYFKTSLVITYSTKDTPTYDYFRFLPCLKTRSLHFSGRCISTNTDLTIEDLSIEYAEFDTFSIGC